MAIVAFGLVGSVSAVEINENLSINGFIDGSISKTDNSTAIQVVTPLIGVLTKSK